MLDFRNEHITLYPFSHPSLCFVTLQKPITMTGENFPFPFDSGLSHIMCFGPMKEVEEIVCKACSKPRFEDAADWLHMLPP